MRGVPPPLMVPTTVTALAAAAGCDANTTIANETAGMRLKSFFIICPPLVIASDVQRAAPAVRRIHRGLLGTTCQADQNPWKTWASYELARGATSRMWSRF